MENGKFIRLSPKARGQFLTALIEEQIQNIEDIKKLNFAGFVFKKIYRLTKNSFLLSRFEKVRLYYQ